jgi:hypothetical protein
MTSMTVEGRFNTRLWDKKTLCARGKWVKVSMLFVTRRL